MFCFCGPKGEARDGDVHRKAQDKT
jgi:hypothetical protein